MNPPLTSAQVRDLLESERSHPLVFVTVGSDHHRFDRIVEWLDDCLDRTDEPVECLVQYGTAAIPRNAHAIDYLDHDLLQRCLTVADIVVVQGGPMSIIEARRCGHRPIVVPRVARLDEVVDDHQVTFCRKLAEQDLITVAEDRSAFGAALAAAMQAPQRYVLAKSDVRSSASADAVERIRRVAETVVTGRHTTGEPTVVLLGGSGRSGSTLFERLLAESPAVAALGETVHLWERGLADDELCGCGEPFSACPFWNKIGIEAFGDWDQLEPGEAVALRRAVVRSRNAAGLLGLPARPSWRLKRDLLARRLTRLYRGAAAVADVRVLVDSSKQPAYAMLLHRAMVDLRCVLVLRDPRAVAYSWQRAVRRPEVVAENVLMPRYGLVRTALTWDLYAILYLALRLLRVPVMVVRYEDLIEQAESTVRAALWFAGVENDDSVASSITGDSADLSVAHTVAGNPMRFTIGKVELRPDDEWRTGLSDARQRLVGLLTWPVRRRYGYR